MLQNLTGAQRRRARTLGLTVLTTVLGVSALIEACDGGSAKKVAFTPSDAGEAGEPQSGSAGTRATGGRGGAGGTRGTTAGTGGVSGSSDLGGAAGDVSGEAGSDVGSTAGSGTGGGGAGGLASGGMSGSGGAATCVADLQNDLNNCGACGRVCAGDQCTFGHCAKALAKGLNGASGVQVDDTYAYFGSPADGRIFRVALAGGTPEPWITGGIATRTEEILLLGDELYWTTYADQKVLKAPKAGGAATTVSTTESIPYGIASNGTDLVWANHYQATNTIGHALISGAATKNPINTAPEVNYPTYVAADATYVYWGNAGDGSVYRAKLDGTTPVALIKNAGPIYGIAVDATNVYFTTDTSNKVEFLPKNSDGTATPTQLGDATDTEPYQILVDGSDIYWVAGGSRQIRHRTTTGTAPETIATLQLSKIDQFLGSGSNTYLAVDATHIYWAESGTQSQHGVVISLERN